MKAAGEKAKNFGKGGRTSSQNALERAPILSASSICGWKHKGDT